MNNKLIAVILIAATGGILGLAVWQQKKRLPELEAKYPKASGQVTPPPGLGKGGTNPLEFASLFQNLKPAKQECFREKFGEERLAQILKNASFVPSPEDNGIIGECLLAGAIMENSGSAPDTETGGEEVQP